MIEFIEQDAAAAALAISDSLEQALDKHSRVLWLVPGGSSMAIAAAAMSAIPDSLCSRLHITLTDERYGPVGHADSNFRQLHEAGFDERSATFLPVLVDGKSLAETANSYAEMFEHECSAAGFVVGHFGIGPDGHIAGILPDSPAAQAATLTAGYKAAQFERLTLTFHAFTNIDIAFATVYGEAKLPALKSLQSRSADQITEPCQILHTTPEAYVYNDCIAGETAA